MEKLTKILVQTKDFDLAKEYSELRGNNAEHGAIVTFVGLVRDFNANSHVSGLFLEHYPGMTEKSLKNIVFQARQKWEIGKVTVIHRVGELRAADQIVLVGVTSQHRENAFNANQFIMDFLKTQAPFWKKELTDDGELWVEAKNHDQQKAQRWQ